MRELRRNPGAGCGIRAPAVRLCHRPLPWITDTGDDTFAVAPEKAQGLPPRAPGVLGWIHPGARGMPVFSR
jgi:hypothetical protein